MNTLSLLPDLSAPPWSGPVPLAQWAGQLLRVDVGDAGVASVLHEQNHVATLFAAHHWIYVLRPGESRGDASPAEVAARSGMDAEDCRTLWPRVHNFDSECQVLLLDTRPLPAWEISGDPGALVRAHPHMPGRFYASFLRNTETLTVAQFTRVAQALVSDGLRQAADAGLDPVESVRRGLAEVGLALEELEFLDSAADSNSATTRRELATGTPPLASSLPRR